MHLACEGKVPHLLMHCLVLIKGSVKFFWMFCVIGGKVGSLSLIAVLCDLKEKGHGKCSVGFSPYSGKLYI